jgi:hypothetical protein
MPAGRRHVLFAATIVSAVGLSAPAVALAGGGGNCSACKVYSEPSGPNAGRKQQPPPQQPTGSGPATTKPSQLPKNTRRVLAQAGKDRGPLKSLLTDGNIGALSSGPHSVGSPSLLGAAFDLGTGPMILLSILLATALGLAARGSLRGWRLRRRPPPPNA